MSQRIALGTHTTFGPMTATAVLQVRPASDVIAERSPTLKWLEIWIHARWSKDDLSHFAAFAIYLAQLIFWFLWFNGHSS